MSEKNQQVYPLAPASSVMPRSDEVPMTAGYGGYESIEVKRKKKRMKCLASITLLAVFLLIIILVFALVLIRVKTPRVRLAYVRAFNEGNGNIRLTMQVRMRNRNFARYKFDNSVATLRRTDTGESIGEFMISEGRARARSTRTIYVLVDVKPAGNSSNTTNNNSGVLRISSEARLRGKVEFLRVFKRRKSAEMNCTMSINLASYVVQDLNCK